MLLSRGVGSGGGGGAMGGGGGGAVDGGGLIPKPDLPPIGVAPKDKSDGDGNVVSNPTGGALGISVVMAKISNVGDVLFVDNEVCVAASAGSTPANNPAAIFIFRDRSASFPSSSNEDWPCIYPPAHSLDLTGLSMLVSIPDPIRTRSCWLAVLLLLAVGGSMWSSILI